VGTDRLGFFGVLHSWGRLGVRAGLGNRSVEVVICGDRAAEGLAVEPLVPSSVDRVWSRRG
jgi:hypothetical protein